MDTLNAMRIFVSVARHGGFSAAARARKMPLPSVVRAISAIESHLGVRLLNRTTRSCSLTEAGQHYLHRCEEILVAVDYAEGELRAGSVIPEGTLIVTAPVLFGQLYIAPLLSDFVSRYPAVRGQLLLLDRVTHLVNEGIDVGIRIGHLADSSIIAHRLGAVSSRLVASPDYLNLRQALSHPRELSEANVVLVNSPNTANWTFHEGRKPVQVKVSGNLMFTQVAAAVQACVSGYGYGRFISYQVDREIREG
jgi:DNA-binding transcriptional LysR family regulator